MKYKVDTAEPSEECQKPVLRIGSKIVQDAYTVNGVLLLPADSVIDKPRVLRRLLRDDVRYGPDMSTSIPIDSKNEAALDLKEDSEEIALPDFKERVKRATVLKEEVVKDLSSVFNRLSADGKVDIPTVQQAVSVLTSEMLIDHSTMVSLVRLKDRDSYTFTHCVNVSILAIYLAMRSGHQDCIEEIAVGSLLHDLGKVGTPHFVLHKDGPLDSLEWNIMKQHPVIGAQILTECGDFGDIEISCVRDHHERISGNGYPNSISGKQIGPYARITALVDVYDALTTDRPYRDAMNPRDALLFMTQQMSKDLDKRLLNLFVSSIGYFPVGSVVELNNGASAIVLKNHPQQPLRPSVTLIKDVKGRVVKSNCSLDLREDESIFIKKFIDERSAVDVALDDAA